MRLSFLSWKTIVSVGAALGLLLIVGPTSPTPALAGNMGGGHHGGGGGGGWSGGGGGVGAGVGIGVGSILLNEAIRRSQERHQAAEPQGCPPGLVRSRHGCKPAKNKGPEVAKCAPPMEPEVAKCEHGDVYRKGKGCVPSDHRPETASCDRPFIKIGNGCGCPPGLIQRGHDCRPPTVVVVPPPVVMPVGPGPEEPSHVVPAATPPAPPPPPRQASPAPPQNPAPIQSLAKIEPAAIRCLPDDLYDLLEQTYGKPPALNRCPSACLPKPASFTPAELDAAAAKSGIHWCENCVQVGGYMPLASVLQLEKAANLTICVNPDMCRLPAAIGGGNAGERVVEIRTVFKDLPAGTKNDGNIAVIVGNQ